LEVGVFEPDVLVLPKLIVLPVLPAPLLPPKRAPPLAAGAFMFPNRPDPDVDGFAPLPKILVAPVVVFEAPKIPLPAPAVCVLLPNKPVPLEVGPAEVLLSLFPDIFAPFCATASPPGKPKRI
jgi:hypothetical protein